MRSQRVGKGGLCRSGGSHDDIVAKGPLKHVIGRVSRCFCRLLQHQRRAMSSSSSSRGLLSQYLACVEPVVYSSVPVPVLQGEAEGGGKQSPSVALRAAAPDRLKRAAPAGVSRPSGTDRH